MVKPTLALLLLLGCGDDLRAGGDASVDDLDECALGMDNCDEHATCTNTPGAFTCACSTGYAGDGVTCSDIDECTANTDNCDGNATCTNTTGSFTCACNSGFTGDGVTCADIDECAINSGNCGNNASCTNTPGSYACACNAGLSGDGVTCVDIDECATNTDNCASNARCANTTGSFACTCNIGFTGNGVTCSDVDECAVATDNCDANATCTNTPGSFTCACNSGFAGNGVSCNDIDECATSTDSCDSNASCANTTGSFACTCNSGFTGNGVTCSDVDECAAATDNCDANATCANTLGSFACACNGGFAGNGVTCSDVDECAVATDNCDANASCTNTPGSFTCACNSGFAGNGVACSDLDECAANTDTCAVGAVCTNTPGSYTCACDVGYVGDGFTCSALVARPLGPLASATVTSRRPTLRWVSAPGSDGTRVELCSDRACTTIIATLDTTATSVAPASDLPPGIVYWRLHGRWGSTVAASTSVTWHFVVGVRSGVTDTSWGSVLDVNGDGFSDVAVGAPITNTSSGRVHVFLGSASGLSSMAATSLTAPDAGGRFGWSVASAGDPDGDGFSDLVVGASLVDRAYVYRGSSTGLISTPTTIVSPIAAGAGFGAVVTGAGDVNHDGYADVAISAAGADGSTGNVFIYLGSANGLSGTPAMTLIGPAGPGHYFGTAVASAGDIDGDGDEELIVSDNLGTYIYRGTGTGLEATPIIYPYTLVGQPGDYNGDGYADVVRQRLVSTAFNLELYTGGPSGLSTAPLSSFNRNLVGGCNNPSGYTAISNAGDVNGDGYGDVVLGMPNAGLPTFGGLPGGYAVVLRGSATGFSPSTKRSLCSVNAYALWGISVAGTGDTDRDGYADVAVGAPGLDAVPVFRGSAIGTIATYAPWLAGPDSGANDFGISVY